jgi:hypothetical protein
MEGSAFEATEEADDGGYSLRGKKLSYGTG